jgi:flagellin-like hook-associated protein FlgL
VIVDSVGVLGGRSQRLSSLEEVYGEEQLHLGSLLSSVEDADPAQAVLELTRAQQALELSHSATAQLLDLSLLNFLR